ncbi:TMEM175 family protein [Kutzneria sp. CA-103260]|uniref:TMEM175 family protein n=1 Tax=Kutzneria sp. CA-103260 TaxID=2802641 RepID=UPI001BA98DA5|nr:TMEM175 family protein [Kutzneria sp. CA-103260]QUQ67594.1 hypothetical protein JJ691_53290 [Kutzneria sp. CA-103260]
MAETAARADVEVAGPERLIYFSDAVIAIAITLLALELPTPTSGVHGDAGVLAFFGEHAEEYLAFLISFGAVAMHWLIHQRLFRHAVGLDGRLIRWNLLWLLMIVLMPCTTKLLTSEVDAFPVQFTVYAADQALAGLFLLLAVADLRRFHLLRADAPAEVISDAMEFMTAVAAMFVLSIPVAFVTNWALLCWLLLPVVRAIVRFVGRRISATA